MNYVDDIYENIKEYILYKEYKILTVFDMIADNPSNKKLTPIITKLFIRERKINTFLFLLHNLILLY